MKKNEKNKPKNNEKIKKETEKMKESIRKVTIKEYLQLYKILEKNF